MTQEELNLIQFAAGQMAQAHTGPPEVVWSELLDLRASRGSPDDAQSTFGVIPSPQIRPVLLIARKTAPCVMPAAIVHVSIAALTQVGTGTVRT